MPHVSAALRLDDDRPIEPIAGRRPVDGNDHLTGRRSGSQCSLPVQPAGGAAIAKRNPRRIASLGLRNQAYWNGKSSCRLAWNDWLRASPSGTLGLGRALTANRNHIADAQCIDRVVKKARGAKDRVEADPGPSGRQERRCRQDGVNLLRLPDRSPVPRRGTRTKTFAYRLRARAPGCCGWIPKEDAAPGPSQAATEHKCVIPTTYNRHDPHDPRKPRPIGVSPFRLVVLIGPLEPIIPVECERGAARGSAPQGKSPRTSRRPVRSRTRSVSIVTQRTGQKPTWDGRGRMTSKKGKRPTVRQFSRGC